MIFSAEHLYELMPALYRRRDEEARQRTSENEGVLAMLLSVMAEQIGWVEEDITQLYDNWFIETSEEWVVPYIGDLLGVQGLHQISSAGFTQRALVANTLAYRRRKGTATMLEQLAHDTTLWPARAVEFFELLGTTQYLNHQRPHNLRAPDLRDINALELLDTPFDTIAHTVDVRHIASGRGKHNIPNIGLFLWRLQAYSMRQVTARALAVPADGRYFFSPLGNDMPLFNIPQTEETITHLAEETNVPAPIRPLAFHLDMTDYHTRYLTAPDRPPNTLYYGPEASLALLANALPIPPMQITCMDLREWDRPPAGVTGLLSGLLNPFPPLTSLAPALHVTIGAEGPHLVIFATVPTTLADARDQLHTALRQAHSSRAFTAARVVVVNDRLMILPGQVGASITFASAPGDPTTAGELALDSATPVFGALSSKLAPFPTLSNNRLAVTIGGGAAQILDFGAIPTSLAQARLLLENTLQATSPGSQVVTTGDRLLVLSGTPGLPIRFDEAADDAATVYQLGLATRVGVDVRLGRLAFAVGEAPASVMVNYTYGFSGDIGGGPYDRRLIQQINEPLPSVYENSVAAPETFASVIRVPSPGINNLVDALAAWLPATPQTVIQIEDNRTYENALTITMADTDLVIQARNDFRPTIIGDITILGNQQGRLSFNGLLISGQIVVEGNESLRQLDIQHCTLVPGLALDAKSKPLHPASPSLSAEADNIALSVNMRSSISGPLHLPANSVELHIQDSLIESPLRNQPALLSDALISENLSPFPALVAAQPQVRVTLGDDGPYLAILPSQPTTLAQARDQLQAAIRAAHDRPAFTEAVVFSADNRLIVLPGRPGAVSIEVTPDDNSAAQLRLNAGIGHARVALISGPLDPLPTLVATPAALTVSIGSATLTATFPAIPTTLAQLRDGLQQAIRTADPGGSTAFANAIVRNTVDNRLVILPGVEATPLHFAPTLADSETFELLKLEHQRPALAADASGLLPSPPTTLERVTVLGSTHVKELRLASETIFTHTVRATRRQVGCVRYSFVPAGSRTPQQFRCQPALALAAALDEATQEGTLTLSPADEARLRQRLLAQMVPAFTSTRYGDPAYGQISERCPEEIQQGAEDGGEMGAFGFLKQPQRVANLQANLDEYLRVGLEAGLFFVT